MSIQFVNCMDTVKTIVDRIANKSPGIYLRFGDGDFNLAENKDDLLARANPELQKLMLHAMSIRDDRVMICIPHHCKGISTLEPGMYPGNHEYPYDYIQRFLAILNKTNPLPSKIYTNVALSYGSVYFPDMVVQLHKEIQKFPVIYIGNNLYDDAFLNKLFGKVVRINTPPNNAFHSFNDVFYQLDVIIHSFQNEQSIPSESSTGSSNNYFVIILAAGCASRAFVSSIYPYFIQHPNFFVFDYGSLLDYLYGLNTRAYMDLMPPKKEYILQQL
jgi:hypothetical protein